MAAKYPYSTKDQVLGGQLSLDIASSAGTVPPTSSYGNARRGKLWLDTSVSPNQLRICAVATAQAGYVAGDWSSIGTVTGGGSPGYLPLAGGTLSGPLQVNSTINGHTLTGSGIFYPAYPGHGVAFEWTTGSALVAHVDGTGIPGTLAIQNQPAGFSSLGVTGALSVGGNISTPASISATGNITSSNSVQGANIITAFNFAGPADYTFYGPGFGAANGISFSAAMTAALGNLQVDGYISIGGMLLYNDGASNLYSQHNLRAPGIISDGNISLNGSVLVNGITLQNNAGYLYTPSVFRTVGVLCDGDIALSGVIWINDIYLQNNAGYLYTPANFRATGLLSDGGAVVSGNTTTYSFQVNSPVSTAIYVPNGGIAAGTDITCGGIYRHAGYRGAQIETWGGDWGAIGFSMSGGVLLVSPDYGVSGYICTMGGAFSDARLKTDIRDTKIDALAAILATPVREFTWDEEGRRLMPHAEAAVPIGFVAQELEETMPLAVGTTEFAGGTRHIIDQQLTPYLVRAIQQLTDRVRDLERKTDD